MSKEWISLRKSTNMAVLVSFRLVRKTKIEYVGTNLRIVQPYLRLTMPHICQKEIKPPNIHQIVFV